MSQNREFWFIPDDQEVFVPALVMGKAPNSGIANMTVVGDDGEPLAGKVVSVEIDNCIRIEDPSILKDAPDDYIALASVNEAAILYNAKKRFFEKRIYTSCGAVLMSVNPFERIPNLYGDDVMVKYRHAMAEDLTAHVYLIPSRAYLSMCSFGRNQSLLISGESGAGKTEATKQCLSFLAAIAGASVSSSSAAAGGGGGRRRTSKLEGTKDKAIDISNRIIAASPILESFGNAQTLRNPNSSRFGKWMELGFDDQGHITGSKITSYLLEKSRVTKVGKGERSYHIFYQLLRGDVSFLSDKSTGGYNYLSSHGTGAEAPDFDDAENHTAMMQAFVDMGFNDDEIQEILKCVCAVLYLGNVSFKDEADGEASSVAGGASLEAAESAAKLISVEREELSTALTTKAMATGARKSIVVQKLNVDKAADTRDSLARALFDRVFIHIINRMNENNAAEKASVTSIGLLDIFGFEIFKDNSFEQLCINYCNEMLQNHFNFVIFTAEKQLYAEENITCDTIEFRDNAAVINDIQAAFLGLDEEAKIPKGNSKTWFDKLVKSCPAGASAGRGGAGGGGGGGSSGAKKYTKFSIPAHKNSFVVSHYAGEVSYLPAMFLEKNTERLSESLLELMSQSSSKVMRALFVRQEEKESGKAQKGTKSISWSFTNQLNSLMTMLRQSDSHFIRCIKSNDACKPMIFDAKLVQKQLLYSGVFEVIKIQQSGLPFRLPHGDFMKRYSCLFPLKLRWTHSDIKAFVKGMKEQLKLDLPTIQIGKTRVFYKGHEHRGFEIARDALLQANARILQRWLMRSTCRSVYKGMLRVREAFKTALNDVDVAMARGAFDQVADCTHRLAALANYPDCLRHVREKADKAMTMLQLQQDLLRKLKEVLPHRTVDGLNEVEELLKKSDEIDMPDHHLVTEGRKVLRDFRNAQAAARMIRENSDFRSLSRDDLQNRIDCISEFKDLLQDAAKLLDELKIHRHAFDEEIKTILPNLDLAIECEEVEMNPSGDLAPAQADKPRNKAAEVLGALDENKLISANCIVLVRDLRYYLKLRDTVIPQGKHKELLDLLAADEATRIVHPVLVSQLALFKEYAYLHLTGTLLEEALSEPSHCIPGKFEDLEAATEDERRAKALPTDKFQTVVDYISVLKAPSANLEERREAAALMQRLRRAYSSCRWEHLRTDLIAADAMWDKFGKESPPRYASALPELKQAWWQVRHHDCQQTLIRLSAQAPFSDTPVSSDDWPGALIEETQIAAVTTGLTDAAAYADPTLSQPMADLHSLLSSMTALRRAVSRGIDGVDEAVMISEALQVQNETLSLPAEVKKNVRPELASCEQFVSVLQFERDLDNALAGEGAFNATMTSGDVFFMGIEDPVRQGEVRSHIVNLANAIEMLTSMGGMLPAKLKRKVVVAKELSFGKKMLLKPSFTTIQEVTAFSGSSGPASMGSFNTWSSALKRLVSFEVLPSDGEHLQSEFSFIVGEVTRRKFYSGFLGVALEVRVSGPVGRLEVHLSTMPPLFKVLVSTFQASGLALESLASLQAYVRNLLSLLSLINEAKWDDARAVMALCERGRPQAVGPSSNDAAEGAVVLDELNDTLFFAKTEVEFHICLRELRQELEGLSVSFYSDGSINTNSIEVVQLCNLHASLGSFRSKEATARQLLSVAKDVISVLLPLSTSGPSASSSGSGPDSAGANSSAPELSAVTSEFVLSLREQLETLSLPAEGIISVTDMIMCDRQVDGLYELIVNAGDTVEDCRALQMELLAAGRAALVPAESLAWIQAAQSYAALLLAFRDGDALAQHQLALAVKDTGARLKSRGEKGSKLKILLASAAGKKRADADMTKMVAGHGHFSLDPSRRLSSRQDVDTQLVMSAKHRRRLSSYSNMEVGPRASSRQRESFTALSTKVNNQDLDLVARPAQAPEGTTDDDAATLQSRLRMVQLLLHNEHNVNVREEAMAGAGLYKSMFDEALRVCQLLPFRWSDIACCLEVEKDPKRQQMEAMTKFVEVYPSAQEDIYIVQILFAMHNVVCALEMGPLLTSTELEPSLQAFLKVADVELVFEDIRSSIQDATALLRRADIVLRAKEHCHDSISLFSELCYDRSRWDEAEVSRSFVLDKAMAEPDTVTPAAVKAYLKCFRIAHKLCIALALKLEERREIGMEALSELIPFVVVPERKAAISAWLAHVPSLHKEQGPRLAKPEIRVKAYDEKWWDDEVVTEQVTSRLAYGSTEDGSMHASKLFLARLGGAVRGWEMQLRAYLHELGGEPCAAEEEEMLYIAAPRHYATDVPFRMDTPSFQELHAWCQEAFARHDVTATSHRNNTGGNHRSAIVRNSDDGSSVGGSVHSDDHEYQRVLLGHDDWAARTLLDLPDPTTFSKSLGPLSDAEQIAAVGSLVLDKVSTLLGDEGEGIDDYSLTQLSRVIEEVRLHCERVAAWWLPLDLTKFTPFSLQWASPAVSLLPASGGMIDDAEANPDLERERVVVGTFHQVEQRPVDEEGGDRDRSQYVDEVLLDSRIEQHVRAVSSDGAWGYWMHPLAALACSLNVELHRLSIWRDLERAALDLGMLMDDALAYTDTAPPTYSSADTAPTIQERCLDSQDCIYALQSLMRHVYSRTSAVADVANHRDTDDSLDGPPELPHTPLGAKYSIYLEYGALVGHVLSLGRVATLGGIGRAVALLADLCGEMRSQQEHNNDLPRASAITTTGASLTRGMLALSSRLTGFEDAENTITDRCTPSVENGDSVEPGAELSLGEELALALAKARGDHGTAGGDAEEDRMEHLQTVLSLVEQSPDLPDAVAVGVLQEVVMARVANKTRVLEAALLQAEANLPHSVATNEPPYYFANMDLHELLLCFMPFIAALENEANSVHARTSKWFDLDSRGIISSIYRSCLEPTPGAAPALCHLESALVSLGKLARPSLRLLVRLMFRVLSTRDLLVHFAASMEVAHGEVLHLDLDRYAQLTPAMKDLLEEDRDEAAGLVPVHDLDLLLLPLQRVSSQVHHMLRRYQSALQQQAEGQLEAALEDVEALIVEIEESQTPEGDYTLRTLPADCFDLAAVIRALQGLHRGLLKRRKELVAQVFISTLKAAMRPSAIVAPLSEELDLCDTTFPYPATYTHLGHSHSGSLQTDIVALRNALSLEATLQNADPERRVTLSEEDLDLVARAKIILQLRTTVNEPGTGAENERLELVNRVDAIVHDWHSGAIEAPDAGLGSEEARATRALLFFDWLYRGIQEAPDRMDAQSVAAIIHMAVRHTGYEKTQSVELYMEQTRAMLDLLLLRDGHQPWALSLVPPPDDDATESDGMVTKRLRYHLHVRQMSEVISRRRSTLHQAARQRVLLMELMRHYCPLHESPSMKHHPLANYLNMAAITDASGSPGGSDKKQQLLRAEAAPFYITDRSFIQLLANLKAVLAGESAPLKDGESKISCEEAEWGGIYDWNGGMSESEVEQMSDESQLPFSQAQFAGLVSAWGRIQLFNDLHDVPGLMYPLAALQARMAMYRRRAIAVWDRARSQRRVASTAFTSPSSFFELSYPSGYAGVGKMRKHKEYVPPTQGADGASDEKKETEEKKEEEKEVFPVASAIATTKYRKQVDRVIGSVSSPRPPLDQLEQEQEADGYQVGELDELSAHLDPATRELRALRGITARIRNTMLSPVVEDGMDIVPGGDLEWRHSRQAMLVLQQSHASSQLDESLHKERKALLDAQEEAGTATSVTQSSTVDGDLGKDSDKGGVAPALMWASRPQQTVALLDLFAEMDELPSLLECQNRLEIDEQVAKTYVRLYVAYQTLQGLSPPGDSAFAVCPSALKSSVETMLRLRLSIVRDDATCLQGLADTFYSVIEHQEQPDLFYMRWASLQNWFELSNAINTHNRVIECMLWELNPAETLKERRKRERKVGQVLNSDSDSGTVEASEEERGGHAAEEGDDTFFTFVNSNNLRTLVLDSDECALQSQELHDLTSVSKYVLLVMDAIEENRWLEHEESLSRGVRCVQSLLRDLPSLPTLPRAVQQELLMLTKVCENKNFEYKLLLALRSHQEYLKDGLANHADIDISELSACLDATSKLRHRGKKNMALFTCATLVLEMRTAVKFADWEEIRRVLGHFDVRNLVPADRADSASQKELDASKDVQAMRDAASAEARAEIDTLIALSVANLEMHAEVMRCFKNHRVGGISYMKLDCSKLAVQDLVKASHTFVKSPRISADDLSLWYSLEKLISLRSSLMMNDYTALATKMRHVKIARVHAGCVEEIVFVKKAVEFSQIIDRVRVHLDTTSVSGLPGSRFVEDSSILHLEKLLLVMNPDACPPSSRAFLQSAAAVLKMRHAIKAMRWDLEEATSCVLSHHNVETAGSMADSIHEPRKIRHVEILKEIFGHIPRAPNGQPLHDVEGSTNLKQQPSMGAIEGHVRRNSSIIFASAHTNGKSGTDNSNSNNAGPTNTIRPSELRRQNIDDEQKTEIIATYRDRPGHIIHISSVFAAGTLDPHGLPSLLYTLTQKNGVLKEAEAEVTLMRDELYHRINCAVLRKALSMEGSINDSHSAASGAVGGMDEQSVASRESNVALDNALASCRHLGIKSEETHRLFQTGLFIRAVRAAYEKGDLEKTMTLLGLIEGLKRNNRFDVVATAEIETIFRNICSATIVDEITLILEDGLLGARGIDNEMRLKRSLRKAGTIDALTEEAVKVLSVCHMIVTLTAALRSCVIERIERALRRCYTVNVETTSTAVSMSLSRLEEAMGDARAFVDEQYAREEQRGVDLNNNTPIEVREQAAAVVHSESKDVGGTSGAMTLSMAQVADDADPGTLGAPGNPTMGHNWLAPKTDEDPAELPIACHTLASALSRAIEAAHNDTVTVHRGGVFQDLLEGVLRIKQQSLWGRNATPVEVGSASTALMLCTLLLVPLTYHPVTLVNSKNDTPASRLLALRRVKSQAKSEIVYTKDLLRIARNIIESVAEQQEERNLALEMESAKEYIAAEAAAAASGVDSYGDGDGDDTGDGESKDNNATTAIDLTAEIEEEKPVLRMKRGPVGAAVVNNAFLRLGEFLTQYIESHLTDKAIRLFAVKKLEELKESRRAKNLIGLDFITKFLRENRIEKIEKI